MLCPALASLCASSAPRFVISLCQTYCQNPLQGAESVHECAGSHRVASAVRTTQVSPAEADLSRQPSDSDVTRHALPCKS